MSPAGIRQISVMLVDDESTIRTTIRCFLESQGYCTEAFADTEACLAAFEQKPADIVITDLRMPGMSGLELLSAVRKRSQETQVILITAYADKDTAIQALKLGAYDFFEKPISLAQLGETIKRTVRYQTVMRERDQLANQLTALSDQNAKQWDLTAIKGTSAAMLHVFKRIRLLQKAPLTSVLLTGESGTGKELLARAIHFGGLRAALPFVAINCSAIPRELAESELFGHVKGAFTGAGVDRKGCFENADGGTLFLDEIGDMEATVQTKLLRVLEDGLVTPVGGAKARKVEVRVVAATNADLETKVASGTFRKDLYYRLARFTIETPSLRQRQSDIPLLTDHFLKLFSDQMGFVPPPISAAGRETLFNYPFPGNVRELRNVVERALIESGGRQVERAHIMLPRMTEPLPINPSQQPQLATPTPAPALPLNLRQAEAVLIQRALSLAQGNISEAARILGINRTKLYRRLNVV